MKHKIFYLFFAIMGVIGILSAFGPTNNLIDTKSQEVAVSTDVVAGAGVAPGGHYPYTVTSDTLTNAEKDTVVLPVNFLSLYTYDIQPVVTQLSGTAAVKVYLDQSAKSSGNTDWFTIDSSASLTNAAPRGILDGTDALGYRYRLRFSGTGTQSTIYACTSIWKRKN